jgi:hypothetical protein
MLAMTDSCWEGEAAGQPRDLVSAGGGRAARVSLAARDREHGQRGARGGRGCGEGQPEPVDRDRLAERAARPGGQAVGDGDRDARHHGQGGQDRDRVLVHRAGQAVQGVEAVAGVPVDRRLNAREQQRGAREQADGAQRDRPHIERWGVRQRGQARPLADGRGGEGDEQQRGERGQPEGDARDDDEVRAAELAGQRGGRRRGGERVRDRARDERDRDHGRDVHADATPHAVRSFMTRPA